MKGTLRLTLFCLAILVSACGGGGNNTPKPTPNDDAARKISAVVAALKSGNDLSIKAEGSESEGVLATGTVDADGKITIELPKTLNEAFLQPLEPNDGCEFNPASNARSFFLPNLTVYLKDKLVGVLVQEDTTGEIERVFVTEDANIKCTNAEANASFKKGWNLVFTDKTTQIGKVIASSSAPWTFTGDITNPNPDTTPPTVLDTFATSATSVEVVFSEPIKGVTPSAFSFPAQDITVNAASLSADKTTVTLTTTTQTVNQSYALLVSSAITDLAGNAFDLNASDPLDRTFNGFNPSNGLLEIIIIGLPAGVEANVEVTGPNSFKQTLTASTVLSNLPIGTYSLAINDVKPDSATFSKIADSPTTVQLAAGIRTIVALVYNCSLVTPPDPKLDAVLKVATGKETYACADLAALTELLAVEQSIENVEGLQYAVGLTSLDLKGNQLTSLPENIFDDMTTLTNLNLFGNQISNLPVNIFDNLTALTRLNLDKNQLSSLPEGIFDNLTALFSLSLNNNQLTSLPEDIFNNLTTLTGLSLGGNQLSSLPANIFGTLTALNGLNLFNNQLTSLPANIFDSLTAVTFIDLFGNQLSSLPANVFDTLAALTDLDLSENCLEPFKVPTKGQLAALASRFANVVAADNPKADCAAVIQPVTLSNFDTNTEGWTVTVDGVFLTHKATGGNPGGFIEASDGGLGSTWYWKAPALYYGDASDYVGKTLKFSLKQSATDSQFEDVDVRLVTATQTFTATLPNPPGASFTDYTIDLTTATFSPAVSIEVFFTALKDLTSLEIRGEFRSGTDTGGLDSVRFGE